MAVVDNRNRLRMKIGAADVTLPIYETHDDFYNGKYVSLKVAQGERYAPISPTKSELTVNAGAWIGGTRYYFLDRAYTKYDSCGGGSYWNYISGGSARMDLRNIITLTAFVPETHVYIIQPKMKMWLSYNTHKHGYRTESYYQFQVRLNGAILADTGDLDTGKSSVYYKWNGYADGSGDYNGMKAKAKWYDFPTITRTLTAGRNDFQLWAAMKENNNKHAAIFVEPFNVALTYT